MLKLYITRHGETEWNIEKKMQGWKNSNLTDKGIASAIKLAESLRDIEFSNIYSSPLGRALETANYVKGDRNTEVEIHEGLKEMGFGLWEGIENDVVLELHREEHFNFWNKPELYQSSGGESFDELFERVRIALKYIIKNATGDNVLIVSHAVTIKTIYSIIKRYQLKDFWTMPFIDGTSLSILEINDDKMEFILEGDTSHLE